MSGPLAGIKVLDMSRVLAGPWAGQLLGDYGADVIKIERPIVGDETRHWGPPWLEDESEAAYFLSANRNKRSVTVDLATAEGAAVIRELADKADVVLENFRVGTMRRYDLDAESLIARNPGLVYCSISAYGQQSSRAHEPGYDAMIQAAAGLMSITGAPDAEGGSPQKVGVAISDIMAGMYATTAILAALKERDKTGKGQTIDVPLYDSQVAWLANQAMNFLIGGVTPGRQGTAHPNIVPYQTFATEDGYITVAVGNDSQFAACATCIGRPELAGDVSFKRNSDRVENRESLVQILSDEFSTRTTSAWLERLSEAGVPAGPINSVGDVLTDEYALERGLVRTMRHALNPELATVANPVNFSRTPVCYGSAPPTLGQHTNEVLGDWLDYSKEKIEALRLAGAI
jgi:crotonobetainyl-CoA:carnitine CoA-transferase CaiB-like acyl-CoA transferase